MSNIYQLALRQKPVDQDKEPCSNCEPEVKTKCKDTCKKATIWWHRFALQFGGKANGQ